MTRGLIPIRRERNGPAAAAGPEARARKTLRPDRIITATTAHAISCCRQTRPKRYCVSSPTIDEPPRPLIARSRRAPCYDVTRFGGFYITFLRTRELGHPEEGESSPSLRVIDGYEYS